MLLLTSLSFCGPGYSCYRWSASLANRAVKYACAGDDVIFPWAVTLSPGETLLTVQWNYQGRSDEILAVFDSGLFVLSPAFSSRVSHVTSEGISLSDVSVGDSGRYSVLVTVRDGGGDKVTLWHLAELRLPGEWLCVWPSQGGAGGAGRSSVSVLDWAQSTN